MKSRKTSVFAVIPFFILASCATTPMGPTVQVMPASTKPFQVFQQDQEQCKQYAQSQVAGQAEKTNMEAAGIGLLSAGLGAGVGAAFGGGVGAAQGAALGAVPGAIIGGSHAQGVQGSIQAQYDNAYLQCMYSKGNQVPGVAPQMGGAYMPPPPANMPPPPPGGMPPPPPPQYPQQY